MKKKTATAQKDNKNDEMVERGEWPKKKWISQMWFRFKYSKGR